MTTQLSALLEVERIAREIVDALDMTNILHGTCDTDCAGGEECHTITTVEALCPKCSEKFDVEAECGGTFECPATCTAEISLDLPDDEQELLRCLRLALVQLDLARNAATETKR